jgi:hypothetical protein
MRIRRPLAALFTALTLLGGGVTLTACEAAGQDQNDGTTDDSGNEDSGNSPSEVPDNSNQEPGSEDSGNDQQDPD